jgi:hypothetical protein
MADARKMWEIQVQKTLNEQRPKGEYILVRSGQLVGTALMLFVKSSKIKYIKRVDGSVKKVIHPSSEANVDWLERYGRE